ncbi:hypothetical protein [Streptomyces sp. NPDC054765]
MDTADGSGPGHGAAPYATAEGTDRRPAARRTAVRRPPLRRRRRPRRGRGGQLGFRQASLGTPGTSLCGR